MTTIGTVRFEDGPTRHLIGIRQEMSMADAPIFCPAMWQEFSSKWPIIQQTEPVSYGVNCQTDMAAGTFEYMAAVEVPEFVEGDDWDRLLLPEAHYAVFPIEGSLTGLGEVYQTIFTQWLPTSGYKMEEKPIYERYGPGYDVATNSGDTEIWVPIIK